MTAQIPEHAIVDGETLSMAFCPRYRQKALTSAQEAKIKRLIADKCPDQLKLPFALWRREAVARLVERETGVCLSVSAIGNYLRSWGFTAQRPMRCASERREPGVSAQLTPNRPHPGNIRW